MNTNQSIFVQNNVYNIMRSIAHKMMKDVEINVCEVRKVFEDALEIIDYPCVYSHEYLVQIRANINAVYFNSALHSKIETFANCFNGMFETIFDELSLEDCFSFHILSIKRLLLPTLLWTSEIQTTAHKTFNRLQHLSQYINQYEQHNNPLSFTRALLSQEKENTTYILTLLKFMFSDYDEYETIKQYAQQHIRQARKQKNKK